MSRTNTASRNANGAGSIRKISSIRNGKEYTYWQARYTVGYDEGTGKQIQRSITGKTQKEVSQKLKQLTFEIDQGTYRTPSKVTVKEWMNTWKDEYLNAVKPSTVYLYSRHIDMYINPALGEIRLSALTTPMVQKFYNSLGKPRENGKEPLAPKTIKGVYGVLHEALQKAVSIGYMRFNPTDACTIPRVVRKEIVPLDENQISLFISAIDGHVHEWAYKIALFTGLREGELLGLSWDCVDLENGYITVNKQLRRSQEKGGEYYFSTPKNGKSRTLTLAPAVVEFFRMQKLKQAELLRNAGKAWNNEHNLVFTNETGGFLSYRTVYDCFKRIVAGIGLPATRFHDLRHSYAFAAIQSGDDIKTVQENLGHATAAFTLDVYGHVTSQMKKASADRMEQFIKQVTAAG